METKMARLKLNGDFAEVDSVELHRVARELRAYLENEMKAEEEIIDTGGGPARYPIREQLTALCVSAISGNIVESLDADSIPFRYIQGEGWLPEKCDRLLRKFRVAACGTAELLSDPIEIDGQWFALRELEEPGDWPDIVRAHEDARRRIRMGDEYVPVNDWWYS